jgi:hypothetical protein
MNLDQFFDHWKIAENPFRGEEARHDAVLARMVELASQNRDPGAHAGASHSDFEKILGELSRPSSSIVFGEKGSGKTAIRLQIAERVKQHNLKNATDRIALVAYDDLNAMLDRFHERVGGKSPLDSLEQFRLIDHIDGLLSTVVPGLVDEVLDGSPTPTFGKDPRRDARRMSKPRREDLLVLQCVYDRPERAGMRSRRLRRALRLSPGMGYRLQMVVVTLGWLAPLAFAIWAWGFAGESLPWASAPLVGTIVLAALWLIALLKYLLWDRLRALRIGRRLRRSIRVIARGERSYAESIRQAPSSARSSSLLPVTSSDEQRYAMLARLLGVLRSLGCSAVLAVVDRVDEPTLVSGDARRMQAIVWPMLNNKFLQQEGFAVKMLLPVELRHALFRESSAFFQEARLDKQNLVERLAWTGAMLYDLCDARLRACRPPDAEPITLLDLFAEDVSRRELVDALDQMHQPRDAFKFLYQCFTEHCSNVTADEQEWRVPRLVLELVRKQQAERVQGLYRGIRPA